MIRCLKHSLFTETVFSDLLEKQYYRERNIWIVTCGKEPEKCVSVTWSRDVEGKGGKLLTVYNGKVTQTNVTKSKSVITATFFKNMGFKSGV